MSFRTDDMNDCFYGSYNTGHYQEQYNITFSADMRGLANPINMSLSSWPVSVVTSRNCINMYLYNLNYSLW